MGVTWSPGNTSEALWAVWRDVRGVSCYPQGCYRITRGCVVPRGANVAEAGVSRGRQGQQGVVEVREG